MMMDTPINKKQQSETTATDLERLAGCGFTSEEYVSLIFLQQWYQAGGSDRVPLVRHWEYLRRLVLTGRLDV